MKRMQSQPQAATAVQFAAGRVSSGDSFDPARRFGDLLQRMGIGSHFDRVHTLLFDHYSEPDRYYHNLDHIRACLERLDEVRGKLHDPDAAEMALWFHDAVYEPAAVDNELRSALLFDRELGVFLPTRRADRVHAMIMATVHPSGGADNDARFVADIDLSGFALPRDEFKRATGLLRRECIHLTDSQFQLGTLAFFKKILARPTIYLTDHFLAEYEQAARKNLCDLVEELEELEGGRAASSSQ